jgi:hypothetical protein
VVVVGLKRECKLPVRLACRDRTLGRALIGDREDFCRVRLNQKSSGQRMTIVKKAVPTKKADAKPGRDHTSKSVVDPPSASLPKNDVTTAAAANMVPARERRPSSTPA